MMNSKNSNKKEGFSKQCVRATGYILLGVIGVVLLSAVFGYFVMHLWNWLMPDIFGLKMITFWQAFGLILLARLIFGGFKHGPNKCDDKKKQFFNHKKRSFMKCDSGEISKWKHYEEFWKEKGEEEFKRYVADRGISECE